MDSTDTRADVEKRRTYIRETVEMHGELACKDIPKELQAGRQSYQLDADSFTKNGLPIRLDRGRFVQTFGPWTYESRKHENMKAKEAIGRVASAMVWGSKEERAEIRKKLTEEKEVGLELLDGFFEDYWSKKNRFVALDAGTTTLKIAEHLTSERGGKRRRVLPDEEAGLAALRLVTNCPKIEAVFENPLDRTEVLLIGGALRKETRSHSGYLARQCLEAWNLQIDLAMIGTTNLITRQMIEDSRIGQYRAAGFACDSEEESQIKNELLARSSLRCVVVDSSKFERRLTSAFCFAGLPSKSARIPTRLVQLVITDDGKLDSDGKAVSDAKRRQREDYVDQLRSEGIPVVVAEV
jgi:DeoR/GlpR family transcriptional regulator of sugar metabolism